MLKCQTSAIWLVQRKAFASLIYIHAKIYNVNSFQRVPAAALRVVRWGNRTTSKKNLPVSNLYNGRLYYFITNIRFGHEGVNIPKFVPEMWRRNINSEMGEKEARQKKL